MTSSEPVKLGWVVVALATPALLFGWLWQGGALDRASCMLTSSVLAMLAG